MATRLAGALQFLVAAERRFLSPAGRAGVAGVRGHRAAPGPRSRSPARGDPARPFSGSTRFLGLAHAVAGGVPARRAAQWAKWVLFYAGPLWASRHASLWRRRVGSISAGSSAVAAVPVALAPCCDAAADCPISRAPCGPGRSDGTEAHRRARSTRPLASEDVLYLQPEAPSRPEISGLLPRREGRPNLYLARRRGRWRPECVPAPGRRGPRALRRAIRHPRPLGQARQQSRHPVRDAPIATRTALAHALQRVGTLMKPEEDVLFLFLTSHGSKDGRFSLSFGRCASTSFRQRTSRPMLDDAGIRNRVIVVSRPTPVRSSTFCATTIR